MLTQFFLFLYCKLLWRGLKFVTRKFTGRCELQRICYNNKHGARRTLKIGQSASTCSLPCLLLCVFLDNMAHFTKWPKTNFLILFSLQKHTKNRIIPEVLQEWGKSFELCTEILPQMCHTFSSYFWICLLLPFVAAAVGPEHPPRESGEDHWWHHVPEEDQPWHQPTVRHVQLHITSLPLQHFKARCCC